MEHFDYFEHIWDNMSIYCLVSGDPSHRLEQVKDVLGKHRVFLILFEKLERRHYYFGWYFACVVLIEFDKESEHFYWYMHGLLVASRQDRAHLWHNRWDDFLPVVSIYFFHLDLAHVLMRGPHALVWENELLFLNKGVSYCHEYLLPLFIFGFFKEFAILCDLFQERERS